ncbi:hypothetical protein ASG69_06875 [Rhodococcus sp. Leaf225]|nr:hypothetical protein ASG69_06875 [Rhodococcus sp. Leaf225]KQU41144.1 hypothetical protein ASH03_19480 [Rhodococcus sp. Leaf258]
MKWRGRRSVQLALALAALVLVAVSGAFFGWASSISYTRTATVTLALERDDSAVAGTSSRTRPAVIMIGFDGPQDAGPVADRLSRTRGGPASDYRNVTITAQGNGNLAVTVVDPDKDDAISIANDAAHAYADLFNETSTEPPGHVLRAEVSSPAI